MEREKVIECLQKAKMVIEMWVPMFYQYNTPAGIDAALALLKEQEALPIVYRENQFTGLPVAHCPSCDECLLQFHAGAYGKETKFCYYCGQAVKWK